MFIRLFDYINIIKINFWRVTLLYRLMIFHSILWVVQLDGGAGHGPLTAWIDRSFVPCITFITRPIYVFFSIYTYYHAYIECNSPYSIYRAQQHIICLFFVLYIYNSGFSSYFEWPAAAIKRKGHFKWRGIYTQQGLHTQQHSSSIAAAATGWEKHNVILIITILRSPSLSKYI